MSKAEAQERLRQTALMTVGYLTAKTGRDDDMVYLLAKAIKEVGTDATHIDEIIAYNERIRCHHGVKKTDSCISAQCDSVNHRA